MAVISDVYFNVAMILSKWRRHQIIKLSHKFFNAINITWSIFASRFCNQTLSIYRQSPIFFEVRLCQVNSNTIELTVHTSCYCVLDLLCVTIILDKKYFKTNNFVLKKVIKAPFITYFLDGLDARTQSKSHFKLQKPQG